MLECVEFVHNSYYTHIMRNLYSAFGDLSLQKCKRVISNCCNLYSYFTLISLGLTITVDN